MVELVGAYVRLQKSGASYRGICPFHEEKTPSFYVHPERGFFHCFGCKASGDALSFLQRAEGLSFVEAARWLAERSGTAWPEETRGGTRPNRATAHRARLEAACRVAQSYFRRQLKEHPQRQVALEALAQRAVDTSLAASFGLGFAPPTWDGLAAELSRNGVSPADALQLGLVMAKRQGSGVYDRFRGRLMFPIFGLGEEVIAFSGRDLGFDSQQSAGTQTPAQREPNHGAAKNSADTRGYTAKHTPKYINSPESPLYRKGSTLFGLPQARSAFRRHEHAIVCEGNFDVLAMHRAGYSQCVAPLGTAFTLEQGKLLRRYVKRVTLVLDGDAAGRKALFSMEEVLSETGLEAFVVQLPEKHDPDTFLRQSGPEVLKQLIEQAPPLLNVLIELEAERTLNEGPQSQGDAVASFAPRLQRRSAIEIHRAVEYITRCFNLRDPEVTRSQLRQAVIRKKPKAPLSHTNHSEGKPTTTKKSGHLRTFKKKEAALVGLLVESPHLIRDYDQEHVKSLLTESDLRSILSTLICFATQHPGCRIDPRSILDSVDQQAVGPLSQEGRLWLEGLLAKPMNNTLQQSAQQQAQLFSTLVEQLNTSAMRRRADRLRHLALRARREGDDTRAAELTQEMMELLRKAVAQTAGIAQARAQGRRYEQGVGKRGAAAQHDAAGELPLKTDESASHRYSERPVEGHHEHGGAVTGGATASIQDNRGHQKKDDHFPPGDVQ